MFNINNTPEELCMARKELSNSINEGLELFSATLPYIIFKHCSKITKDSSYSTGYRIGRFNLGSAQHRVLVEKNGYYMFTVTFSDYSCITKLVQAHKIRYKPIIGWVDIFTPYREVMKQMGVNP